MRTLRGMAWALAVTALGAAVSIAAAAEPAKAAAPAKPAAKTAPAPAKDEPPANTGRVAGEDGKPVAKATVRVLVVKDERARGRFGRARERDVPTALATGDDGTFRATVPARAKTRVRIEAKGFAPFNADDVPAGAALPLP